VPDRSNARQHLAFGHGIHTCPGAPLARAEARIGIQRILERMSDIAIDETEHGPAGARRFDYAPTYILRGLNRLHLTFTPLPADAPGAGTDAAGLSAVRRRPG
jgi:cytochrome P450